MPLLLLSVGCFATAYGQTGAPSTTLVPAVPDVGGSGPAAVILQNTSYTGRAIFRLSSPNILPFSVSKQQIIINAAQATIYNTVGAAIELLDYEELLANTQYAGNTLPAVDLSLGIYFPFNSTNISSLPQAEQPAAVEETLNGIYNAFLAVVVLSSQTGKRGRLCTSCQTCTKASRMGSGLDSPATVPRPAAFHSQSSLL